MKDDTMSMLTWSMLQDKTFKFYAFMEVLFIQCLLKMINKYSVYITRAEKLMYGESFKFLNKVFQ